LCAADWTLATGDWCGAEPYTDLWAHDAPAFGQNNSWACSQQAQGGGCRYEDDIFTNFTLEAILAHDPLTPLMVYYAPHIVHMPLEVPDAQLALFANVSADSQPRRFYAAMVNLVDTHIGMIVDALKARGMWNETLLILSADNGGPVYGGSYQCTACDGDAGANNFPLRGGKHSNFEGGVRVNAFVSGGFLPPAVRGTVTSGLAAIEDWYVTLTKLAGADPFDERAAAAGLPPVEGYDLWPLLSGTNLTSPRTEVWLGGGNNATVVQGLIRADGWKLLHGLLSQDMWQGPFYPNSTTEAHPWSNKALDCGSAAAPACLFNVLADPTEHANEAAAQPAVVAEMTARIAELQATVFSPDRGTSSPLACNVSAPTGIYRGFVGPFMP
jgi:arylsulfatase B